MRKNLKFDKKIEEEKVRRLYQSIILVFIFLIIFCSGLKKRTVEKIIENEVEVVINHLEPYKIKGEPSTFLLKKEFEIDTERRDLAEKDMINIGLFAIDKEGGVYILCRGKIFKFDNNGHFIESFGNKGQGPGEIQEAVNFFINEKEEIVVTDRINYKIIFYNKEGSLIKEIKLPFLIENGIPLNNGNYLLMESVVDPSGKTFGSVLRLYNSHFKEIKILDERKIPNPIIGKRIEATYHNLVWSVSGNKIFTGSQDRGYEINVYTLEGNLLRKIRKEFKKIPPTEKYKKEYMELFKSPFFDKIRDKFYFPKYLPPFHSFTTDEKGRLYVMTYERGKNSGEYIFDIFNSDGVFIFRKSLKDISTPDSPDSLRGKFKNNHFYGVYVKPSGFEKLVVYKIIWK